jgi:CubicO group peptidase (beta-lactamase class C family)
MGWRASGPERLTMAAILEAVLRNGRVEQADPGEAPWWSFGKTVLAAAALVLVERGRLSLDDPRPGAPYALRQLLAHTSGLPDYGGVAAYHADVAAGATPWSRAAFLERSHADRLLFPPGQGWSYSNIGYRFVVEAIEQAADAPLDDALQTLVLQPLGVAARLARAPADLAGVAHITDGYDPGWVFHGLLVGTVGEAARWLDRYLAGGLIGPDLLAQAASLRPLGFPTPGRPVSVAGYGLGLMGEADPAAPTVIGHTGGGPDSLIVVRRLQGAEPVTVALSTLGSDQGRLERLALKRLGVADPEGNRP